MQKINVYNLLFPSDLIAAPAFLVRYSKTIRDKQGKLIVGNDAYIVSTSGCCDFEEVFGSC